MSISDHLFHFLWYAVDRDSPGTTLKRINKGVTTMPHYYMFYKPFGCVTARRDDRYPTVMDYFME